jgi:subtilisin-like proprotein convertase family protein
VVGLILAFGVLAASATAALAAEFSNSTPITINDFGEASPYPAEVTVSGLASKIEDLNVTLDGLSHSYPDDLDVLLVGPGGQKVLLMSDVGGAAAVTDVTLTFDDEAAQHLLENP